MTSHSPQERRDENDGLRNIYAAYETSGTSDLSAGIAGDPEVAPRDSPRPHPHIGWALLWMLVFWFVQIAVSVAVVAIAIMAAVGQGQASTEQIDAAMADVAVIMIPVGTLFSVITAVVIALIFYRRHFADRLALRGMAGQHWVASLLVVLPLAVVASEVTNWAGEVLPHFNADILDQFGSSPWPLVFVAACLFPAIGEEIFCRGFLGRGLVAHHGAIAGVLLASLLFGIMHIDPVQSVGAFVLGLGLHFVYLTTRSLVAPMLVHMLNNAFAFWVMRNYEWCPLPGLSPLPDGSQVHTPPSVMIAAVVAAVALLALLYQTRTRWLLTANGLPRGEEPVWSPGYVTAEQPPQEIACHAEAARPKMWLVAIILLSYVALLAALAVESRAVFA
ncbi:MAG: CPBP family intramembrane glutamic endopeptidase, partial [Pirellulaceae bacterium]